MLPSRHILPTYLHSNLVLFGLLYLLLQGLFLYYTFSSSLMPLLPSMNPVHPFFSRFPSCRLAIVIFSSFPTLFKLFAVEQTQWSPMPSEFVKFWFFFFFDCFGGLLGFTPHMIYQFGKTFNFFR